MISESRGICESVLYTVLAFLIAQTSSALAGSSLNSQRQNAINPRNSTNETPTANIGGKEFL